MEKRTPHFKLPAVKVLVRDGKVRATATALVGASALGLSFGEMLHVVMNLSAKDFYKSMTAYADHLLWQDVYCPSTPAGVLYLKLLVQDDVLIISFKER